MVEMVFKVKGIKWILGARVQGVEDGVVHYETLEGKVKSETSDFAMLIPASRDMDSRRTTKMEQIFTEKLFKGFMILNADYTSKHNDQWSVQDRPETYQNPSYPNIFAPGMGFAPPHSISKQRLSPTGTEIFPSPPRTGTNLGIIAKLVSDHIVESIKVGKIVTPHKGSLGNMGAACIASVRFGATKCSAISITTYPIVPDYQKYKGSGGGDLNKTFGEIGLAGHWVKHTLHHAFLWKAKMRPLWFLIPE